MFNFVGVCVQLCVLCVQKTHLCVQLLTTLRYSLKDLFVRVICCVERTCVGPTLLISLSRDERGRWVSRRGKSSKPRISVAKRYFGGSEQLQNHCEHMSFFLRTLLSFLRTLLSFLRTFLLCTGALSIWSSEPEEHRFRRAPALRRVRKLRKLICKVQ